MFYEYHDFEARYRKEMNDGDTRRGRSCSSIMIIINWENVRIFTIMILSAVWFYLLNDYLRE